MNSNVHALTSLDGRYEQRTQKYQEVFSEYALMKYRAAIEIRWLKFLLLELKLSPIAPDEILKLEAIATDFTEQNAIEVKELEKTTNHDVKAIEYYLRNRLTQVGLGRLKEWIHFGCTSEDINNTSYALMMGAGLKLLMADLEEVLNRIEILARAYKTVPMISRTHGQPASPTTVGKEFVNYAWRLKYEFKILSGIKIQGKINGAVGNFNAHSVAFPEIDWINASRRFIQDYLNIEPLTWTTQINPYNYISQIFHAMIRISSILIDLDRDLWGYISLGYFKQKVKEGEVGSSTMPHKINPIDFENSEGNLGIGIAIMEHIAVKLLNSRFQRDLTDSTVMRNLGSVFGYMTLGATNSLRGLNKLEINEKRIAQDLEDNYELLAEAVQTVARVYGVEDPYDKLKKFTQGQKITQAALKNFIENLEIPVETKSRLQQLAPSTYIGLADKLVELYFLENH